MEIFLANVFAGVRAQSDVNRTQLLDARINKESGTEPLGTCDTQRNLSSGVAAIVPQLHLEAQGSMMRPQLRS